MSQIRLDKFLSGQMPEISRTGAKELLKKGLVTVDGVTVKRFDHKLDPKKAVVAVSGNVISYREHLYIMLNKPSGVVCATRDKVTETVMELLPPELRRQGLFPAGRLDKDSVGFVLLTDDGDLAHRMLSPVSHVPKKYFVRLENPVEPSAVDIFASGMAIDGDEKCLPAELEILSENECFVTLHEGKFHQIKRMFEATGNQVTYLKRVKIGGVDLDDQLEEGKARLLEDNEIKSLISCQ
ncbi:MAG: 16S rRNA pseudouridine(516) synthase [Oscillospiraceae bacterium]|nr:16S rRNA pseudouridine(516) synthase [Oscillospiraceae bacterium]